MNITLDRPFSATEKGKRKGNEDFIYPLSELANANARLFIVCDGVGGAEKGEVASALACDAFQTYFTTFLEDNKPSEDFINKAVRYTEARFDEYIRQNPEALGMATTLALIYIGTAGITVVHIGDSRIYQFRGGNIIYKTSDHSLVNSYVQLGIITPEEAAVHPQKNVITRALMGSEQPVEADINLITDIRPGDRFFICTDGVTNCLSDEELSTLFINGGTSESIKNKIVEHCMDKAKDNFSFYILPVRQIEKKTGYKQFILSFFYSFV